MYYRSKEYDELPYSEDKKIPYIGAKHAEIQRVCENIKNMGVTLSHIPTLSAYYADEIPGQFIHFEGKICPYNSADEKQEKSLRT